MPKKEDAMNAVLAQVSAIVDEKWTSPFDRSEARELDRGIKELRKLMDQQEKVKKLLSAADKAESFLRTFEEDWNELTDYNFGKWGGLKPAKKLREAIEAFEAVTKKPTGDAQ